MATNPTPLSTKPRYWNNDLNQPLLVIERDFFSENPREIVAKYFQENFHYPSSDILKTREFYEAVLTEIGSVKIKTLINSAIWVWHSPPAISIRFLLSSNGEEILIFQGNFLNHQSQGFLIIGIIREHGLMLF